MESSHALRYRPRAGAAMSADLRTSVVVVGGGPAGLAAAMELTHHGVASVLVEPRESVSYLRPRAKTTSARTMSRS